MLTLPQRSALVTHAAAMVEGVNTATLHEPSQIELACFELLVHFERAASLAAEPDPQRQMLLAQVREQVLARLSRRLDVETLADAQGLSRSHFTRHFRLVTGMSPARYAAEVRLEEARRWIGQTNEKFAAVARRTGFADATHLIKAFTRRYHISPGQFRQQAFGRVSTRFS